MSELVEVRYFGKDLTEEDIKKAKEFLKSQNLDVRNVSQFGITFFGTQGQIDQLELPADLKGETWSYTPPKRKPRNYQSRFDYDPSLKEIKKEWNRIQKNQG